MFLLMNFEDWLFLHIKTHILSMMKPRKKKVFWNFQHMVFVFFYRFFKRLVHYFFRISEGSSILKPKMQNEAGEYVDLYIPR